MDGWAISSIITLIIIPISGWYLSRLIKQRDKLEADARRDWQKGAAERYDGLVKRFDSLESCIKDIKVSLNGKLDFDAYAHHEHAIDCDSKACSARRTSGVII